MTLSSAQEKTHHQTREVQELLARYQVVFFVGARGTGKTYLADALERSYSLTGVETIRLDGADALTPADLNAPVAVALGCDDETLTADHLGSDRTIKIIVDAADQLHDRPWLPLIQEQWRALLSEKRAKGRLGLILLGRPLFRSLATGHGSPLAGLGMVKVARPLDVATCVATFDADEGVARGVLRKTGGHPYLTEKLLAALQQTDGDFSRVLPGFLEEARRYVLRLIEDHGVVAREVLGDLLQSSNGVSEEALVDSHFGAAVVLGEDCLDDLEGSGLLVREGQLCLLKAELVRAMHEVRHFIGAHHFDVPVNQPLAHANAAKILYAAENELRKKVGDWLSAVDQAWWPSRVSEAVVAEAELRRRSELESSVAPDREPHPVLYLTLGELFDIISSNTNWQQVFRVRFGLSRARFLDAASCITGVRNKVAHNRAVTTADLGMLNAALVKLGLISG
jgi:hypothetical protein